MLPPENECTLETLAVKTEELGLPRFRIAGWTHAQLDSLEELCRAWNVESVRDVWAEPQDVMTREEQEALRRELPPKERLRFLLAERRKLRSKKALPQKVSQKEETKS